MEPPGVEPPVGAARSHSLDQTALKNDVAEGRGVFRGKRLGWLPGALEADGVERRICGGLVAAGPAAGLAGLCVAGLVLGIAVVFLRGGEVRARLVER